ncbi:hypothetical protein SAMN02745213_01891 [Succinivibrio dextrinosolvens DSM 3072]|uniref:Uncharacterized protein n=1 Tax=Succinivibrio dextrinosolvens DSM 3072 TaxID=1123324 RepID=A0A1T4VPZ7_9GAMM|nr:hypothetical protein [Succinivibrio dextrinosolvens]SKA66997.1 hypothetical protein SAMN02745213_01891 [Succinivibrio dextrinosolvens DSM 3072]
MPGLFNLQKLASGCPLDFKTKCSKQKLDNYGALSAMYKDANSTSKKAYLDLLVANALGEKISRLFNGALTGEGKTLWSKQSIQALICDLLAENRGAEQIKQAQTAINDYIDKVSFHCQNLSQKKLARLNSVIISSKNIIKSIAENKLKYAQNIIARENHYLNAANNISKLDIKSFNMTDTFGLKDETIENEKLSVQLGTVSMDVGYDVISSAESKAHNKNYQDSLKALKTLNDVSDQVYGAFRDSTFNGHTIDTLKKLVVEQGFSNEHLLHFLNEKSNETFNKIKGNIDKLFSQNPSADQIANELLSVKNDLNRKVSGEQKRELVKYISQKVTDHRTQRLNNAINQNNVNGQNVANNQNNVNGQNVANNQNNVNGQNVVNNQNNVDGQNVVNNQNNVNGQNVANNQNNVDGQNVANIQNEFVNLTKDAEDNYRFFCRIMSEARTDENIQNHFSEILTALSAMKFKFIGISELLNLNGTQEEKEAKLAKFIKDFAKALDSKDDAISFLDSVSNTPMNSLNKRVAMDCFISPFTSSSNQIVSQKALKMHQTLVIMPEINDILDKIDAVPNGETPVYGEKTKYIKDILLRIMSNEWANIDSVQLKYLVEESVNGPLKELAPYWNTILDAAYHAFIEEWVRADPELKAPANVHAIKADEMAPDAAIVFEKEDLRELFLNQLSDGVLHKLYEGNMGLVRDTSQTKNIQKIVTEINKRTSDQRALKTLMTSSVEGKKMLATKELVEILKGLGVKADNMDKMTPDELMKLGIDKTDLIMELNSKAGVPREYVDSLKNLQKTVGLPTVNKLRLAQKVPFGEPVKGQETAVSLSVIKDTLVDDLMGVNSTVLESYGIDKSKLSFTPEEITLAKNIQKYNKEIDVYNLKRQHNLNPGQLPPLPCDNYPNDDKSMALYNKMNEALQLLGEKISETSGTRPLSHVTKLMLDKYVELSLLHKGRYFAPYVNNGAFLAANDQMSINEYSQYIDGITDNYNIKPADPEIVKYVLNDLCTANNIDDWDGELQEATRTARMTVADKKVILNNLAILEKNIDPATFLESKEETEFSRDLRALHNASDEEFNEKLLAFSSKYINKDVAVNSDSVVLIKTFRQSKSGADAAGDVFNSAFRENNSEVITNLRNNFTHDMDTNVTLRQAQSQVSAISKQNVELVRPLGFEYLNKGSVRTLVRMAASYAAAKLGYTGKEDVYSAYKDSKTSITDKLTIRDTMIRCLMDHGIDESMAKILTETRLNQTSTDFVFARAFNKIKNNVLGMFSDIAFLLSGFFTPSATKEHQRRVHDFNEYLPAVQGMINRLGENEVRYVSRHMDFKFTVGIQDHFQSFKDTNLGILRASLKNANDAAIMITRDQNGKIKVNLNTTIFDVSVEADAILAAHNVKGIGFNASAGGGRERILNLNFDSDNEASAFLCKLFTSQLTKDDIRAATDVSSGTKGGVHASATARLNLLEIVADHVYPSDFKAITNAHGKDKKDLENQFAKEHPLYSELEKWTRIGAIEVGGSADGSKSTVFDNTGSTETKKTVFKLTNKTKVFTFKPGKMRPDYHKDDFGVDKIIGAKDIAEEAVDTFKNITIKQENENAANSDASKEFADKFKKIDKKIGKINSLGLPSSRSIEIEKIKHFSAGKKIMDEAYEKVTYNYMSEDSINDLFAKRLISAQVRDNLLKLAGDEKITKYTIVRKLKQDVINANKDEPAALEKAADKVNSNYFISEILIETSAGSKAVEENENWMNFVTGGYLSYKVTAQSNSTNVLHIQNTGMLMAS